MKNEVIFTSFDLNEVTLSTAALEKAAGSGMEKEEKPTIKIDQLVVQTSGNVEQKPELLKVNRQQQNEYNESFNTIRNIFDQHFNNKFHIERVSGTILENLFRDIRTLFLNPKTIAPEINLVITEANIAVVKTKTININLSDLVEKYNLESLNDKSYDILFKRLEQFANAVNTSPKVKNVKIKIDHNKQQTEPEEITEPSSEEELEQKLEEELKNVKASVRDKQYVKDILKKYNKSFNKWQLIHFILDTLSLAGAFAGVAGAVPTGGVSLFIGAIPDLLNAVLYFRKAMNAPKGEGKEFLYKGLWSLLGAIPVGGKIGVLIAKTLKTARNTGEILKLFKSAYDVKSQVIDFIKSKIFKSLIKRGFISDETGDTLMGFVTRLFTGDVTSKLVDILNAARQQTTSIEEPTKPVSESLQRKNKRSLPNSTHSRKRVVPKQQLISESQIHRWQVLANIKK